MYFWKETLLTEVSTDYRVVYFIKKGETAYVVR